MVNFVLSMEEFGSSITMVHDNKLDLIHDFFLNSYTSSLLPRVLYWSCLVVWRLKSKSRPLSLIRLCFGRIIGFFGLGMTIILQDLICCK
jgi:hypothetical protein